MVIGTNTTALVAASNLSAASNDLATSVQRLSTGLKINDASDDPAGYAISRAISAQISGINEATKNGNDATNLVKTASSALNQVQDLLVSMRQLAVQASNEGANDVTATDADQAQINSDISSINYIAQTTSFGSKHLLDGSASSSPTVQSGSAVADSSNFNVVSQGNWDTSTDFTSVTINQSTQSQFIISTGGFSQGGTPENVTAANASFAGAIGIDGSTYTISSASQVSLAEFNQDISASGYTASFDSNNDLILTNSVGGQVQNQSVDTSGLVISGNAPVLLTNSPAAGDQGNVLEYTAGPGTGGSLPPNLSSVDSSTPISISGTINFTDYDPNNNLIGTFNETYANGTSINQLQNDLNSTFGSGNFTLETDSGGDLYIVDNQNEDDGGDNIVNNSANSDFVAYNTAPIGAATFVNGSNATATITDSTGDTSYTSSNGVVDNGETYYAFANGLVLSSNIDASTAGVTQLNGSITTTAGAITEGTGLVFQLGANAGQTVTQSIASVAADQLGRGAAPYQDATGATQTPWATSLADVNVTSFKGAQDAIAVIDKAMNDVDTIQTQLGATQSYTLQNTNATLNTMGQDLSASLSTIEDVDLSSQIVAYTQQQVLIQAATSALTQATQMPEALLMLLH